MKPEDVVLLYWRDCEHDMDGTEHLTESFKPHDVIPKLTKDHHVYRIQGQNPRYLTEIEIVGKQRHGFLKIVKQEPREKIDIRKYIK